MPEGNYSTVAATGTTPILPILVLPTCAERFHRHYSRQPALLNRRYRGTTINTVVLIAYLFSHQVVLLQWLRVGVVLRTHVPDQLLVVVVLGKKVSLWCGRHRGLRPRGDVDGRGHVRHACERSQEVRADVVVGGGGGGGGG